MSWLKKISEVTATSERNKKHSLTTGQYSSHQNLGLGGKYSLGQFVEFIYTQIIHLNLVPLFFAANNQRFFGGATRREKEREACTDHAAVKPGGAGGTSVYSTSSQLLINLEIFTNVTQHRAIIKPRRNRNMSSRDL